MPLFDCVQVESQTKAGKPKTVMACPHCHARGIVEEISTRGVKFGAIPVLVSYICENGCKPARGERRHNDADATKRAYFEQYDLGKLREIEAQDIPYWYSRDRMMHAPEEQEEWGLLWRPYLRGVTHVHHLYTKRSLWAVAAFRAFLADLVSPESATPAAALWTILTTVSLTGTKMLREEKRAIQAGTYYLPSTFREIRISNGIEYNLFQLIKGIEEIDRVITKQPSVLISTQSATDLSAISANSVDYIFTDPPYSWKVQYGETNFVWEAWLGFDTTWHRDEIIVNEVRGKSEADWARMMCLALAECFRVLKPGRWLSLCYHDTSEGTWSLVQDLMAEVGFLVDRSDDALYIDASQKSRNQQTADKVTKRDLVINFRKPRLGETAAALALSGDEDEPAFLQGVRALVHDFLAAQPGATKDRVYDHVVSRLVRAGRMQAHDFESLLRQVADPIALDAAPARWYLKDAALVEDRAETQREDAAAASLSRLMRQWLTRHPGEEGVHYSDLFEHYVYAVHDKPRRTLAEWLPDYFYQTDEGTYRLPQTAEEAEAKAHGRTAGTNRRIKRYLALVESGQGVSERVSDATLAEWIRHAKRAGLYAAGVALYERGGLNVAGLSEEGQVGVEEDYATCVRLLARGQADKAAGSGGKKRARKSEQPELGL